VEQIRFPLLGHSGLTADVESTADISQLADLGPNSCRRSAFRLSECILPPVAIVVASAEMSLERLDWPDPVV
jgi:hypothetical protein